MVESFFILPYTFLFLYLLLISLCIIGWLLLPSYPADLQKTPSTKVSVIIAARNEEDTIRKCLSRLFKQDYPKKLLEIIIVDDDSEDNTSGIVQEFIPGNHNLKLIRLKTGTSITSPKKRAITEGIIASSGDLIITTDADCIAPENLVKTIVGYYEKYRPKMIIGPVAFYDEKSIFEKMQSIEFSGLIATGAASCYFNKPLLCNGANLAYEKKAFMEVKGFERIDHNVSGDDVLLMFKFEKIYPGKINFLKSKEAIVFTKAKRTVKEFIDQRVRWASKNPASVNLTYIYTGLIVTGFNLILLILLILSLFNPVNFKIFLVLFISKCIIDFLFLILAGSFFTQKRYLLYLIPQQLLYIFYVPTIVVLAALGKYSWKGRMNKR